VRVLAAQGDTWGISGAAFIKGYVFAAVAALLLALLLRQWARRGRPSVRELHPYELAYLAGGGGRAIAAAVAALRMDGAIEPAEHGKLRVTGQAPAAQSPLDQAILSEIEQDASLNRLRLRYSVRQAVDGLEDGLVRDGLISGPDERMRARLAVAPLLVVGGVGVARLVAGMSNGKPVGFLLMALIGVGVATLILLFRPVRITRAGETALRLARRDSGHLNPAMAPAWPTYGATGAALGVALFGTAALLSFDPDFASETGVVGYLGLASSSGSGGFWSGGGSGYAGSCSGASSGGGGGGCGGGGCGG
jgi:uncharacterized protein (TIGR04222 family)